MKKRIRIGEVLLLTMLLTLAFGISSVFAQDEYDPIVGPSHHVQIKKTLDLNGAQYGPSHTVTFKTNFVSAVPNSSGVSGDVQDVTMDFSGSKTTDTKYIDFSTLSFTKPGIYTYQVKEVIQSGVGIISADNITSYYVKIYVDNVNVAGGDSELVISGYVYSKSNTDTEADKVNSLEFNNKWDNYRIRIRKEVTGNQGDKSFPFSITLSLQKPSLGSNSVYVRWANGTPKADNNPVTPEAAYVKSVSGSSLSTTNITLSLKDDDEVIVEGLISGYKYMVTEPNPPTGYTVSGTVKTFETVDENQDKLIKITNHKGGTIPTGIFINNWPYILVIIAALAGCIVFVRRRKASYEYNEDL